MRSTQAVAALLVLALVPATAFADPVGVNDLSTVDRHGHVHDDWQPLAANGSPMESKDFYRQIGRPDLADEHDNRRMWAIGSLVGGVALAGVSAYYISQGKGSVAQQSCNVNDPYAQFSTCVQYNADAIRAQSQAASENVPIELGTLVGAGVALGISAYFFTHPEPISAAEAEGLASEYNNHHITSIAPYTDGNGGGGVVVAGRF